jgi:predicted amidohydrolase
MTLIRIALANLRFPGSPEESVELTREAIAEASREKARIVCFPECYVPGYRAKSRFVPPPDPVFLTAAWRAVESAAAQANIAVVLGTERVSENGVRPTVLVVQADGTRAGFQDKVQLHPSEEARTLQGTDDTCSSAAH